MPKPRHGLRCYLAQRRRAGADAEAKELALPWPSHGALLGVDLEFQAPGDERADTVHHSLPRAFASRVDITVSRPGESHPRALAEPYVNVAAHTAPIIQPWA